MSRQSAGDELSAKITEAIKAVSSTTTLSALESLRVAHLGRKGYLTLQLKRIGSLSVDERKAYGKALNTAKQELTDAIDKKAGLLEQQAQANALNRDIIDVSLPGRAVQHGTLHPISRSVRRITAIFRRLGFDVADGPEIEDDFHNFGALNIPEDHPARAMHDTFYVSPGVVLRTHTSPVQVRYMENQELPIRVIAPGRVYRCDSDVTHTPMFNQVEGLAVDIDITFADLKGILIHFVREFFEQDLPVRFRPSYFPFTEPSAEVGYGVCFLCWCWL